MGPNTERTLIDAAESYLSAAEALQEARDALDDPRLAAEAEQGHVQGSAAAASRADQALKRGAEALKKATVAAAATRLPGAHGFYLRGKAALDTVKDLMFALGPTDWDGEPSQADVAMNEAHCCGRKTRQKKEGIPWF